MSGNLVIKGRLYPGMISIGAGRVGIFDFIRSRCILEIKGTVIFNGKAKIGHGSKICVGKKGQLVLGNNFQITAESTVVCFDSIVIGNDCLVSWDVLIMDNDFHSIIEEQTGEPLQSQTGKIEIGNHVWICCRSTILKGIAIDSNNVIAADTTMYKSLVGENVLIGGNPPRILKSNINWKK